MYPKIGIRPVIDGRQFGVREDLEQQTMHMANAAKDLIESNLRYPDGTKVECVIAPTTIGGGAEAYECETFFQTQNVCATLSVTPCWCYGSETMDLNPLTIKAVWGFNGTERPGAVYLAACMAAHAQRGLPAFSIYGHDVQDKDDTSVPADVREKILRFAKCAIAVGVMRNKAYVGLGGVSMGIAGSYCNSDFFQKYLGIRAEMPVTMIRLNILNGTQPLLQIAEGYTVDLPDEIHNPLDARTDKTWPTTWFVPNLTGEGAFADVYHVMANWGANHGCLAYGHIGADLITLASMLRIPVSMHNVPENRIYRPHTWSAFGTKDLEAADYRACEAYGPIYQ